MLTQRGAAAGDVLVVAFSGGPDSLALLLAAAQLAPRVGLRLAAAHLDHALDPGSAARAARAGELAAHLEAPFLLHRLAEARPATESREAFARRARYRFLAAAARATAGKTARRRAFVATAHHADDQAETVLLRLLFGSGLEGLGGIAAHRPLEAHQPGADAAPVELIRPLLGLRRGALRAAVDAAGLSPIDDPTNLDAKVPRNRVRHALLPALAAADGAEGAHGADGGALVPILCRLAAAARSAAAGVAAGLARRLAAAATESGSRLARRELEQLPEILHGPALSLLHRLAGEAQPAPLEARRELFRQLRRPGGKVRCDCGGRAGRNFFWQANRYTLELRRAAGPEPKADQFTYTFEVSGAEPQER